MPSVARPRGTDGSLLASLPWTLVALAVALVPHVPYLPIWITGAAVCCGAWRYLIERRRRPLPSPWLRAALALVSFLGVLFVYSSISGVGPGSALLAIMASLKLLETRQRRDQFVLLFISIFLVMSSLLREQYLWSLPYLVVSVLMIMTAWLRTSATPQESARDSIRAGSRLVMYAAPVAIAMWVFFPRIATPFWSVPIDTSSGVTGLSETMSPGDISSLSRSDAVAFRVTFADAVPPPQERYWRGIVLTQFNGRSWSGSEPLFGGDRGDVQYLGDPIRYRITLEPTRQQWVFALDMPYGWDLPRTQLVQNQQLARIRPIDQRIAYNVISYVQYRSGRSLRDPFRHWYMHVPPGSNPQTAEFARDLRASVRSDKAYIDAVLRKFHDEPYFYTLEPPPLGSQPVDRFLFDTRRGFCEHYASAFAVLMREAGIPARVVLGYQGGEVNPLGNYMIVRQSDAHAWTEVWLDESGWTRIDPTSAIAPERVEVGGGAGIGAVDSVWGLAGPAALWHRLGLTVDAINARWNDWILGYGPDNQNRFMRWLGMDDPGWRQMLLTLVACVVGLLALISLLLTLRYRPPRKDRAATFYRRFVARTKVAPRVGETPANFAARAAGASEIPAAAIDRVTAAYLDARYGSESDAALGRLAAAVSALR
jgi:transglutaminase-like putative cysteine protease